VDDGVVLIATALATASSGPYAIMLWQWGSKSNQNTGRQDIAGERWTFWEMIDFLFKMVVVFMAMAYFFGSIKQAVCNLYLSFSFFIAKFPIR